MSDGDVEAGRFRRKRWDSKTRTCGGQEDVSGGGNPVPLEYTGDDTERHYAADAAQEAEVR